MAAAPDLSLRMSASSKGSANLSSCVRLSGVLINIIPGDCKVRWEFVLARLAYGFCVTNEHRSLDDCGATSGSDSVTHRFLVGQDLCSEDCEPASLERIQFFAFGMPRYFESLYPVLHSL